VNQYFIIFFSPLFVKGLLSTPPDSLPHAAKHEHGNAGVFLSRPSRRQLPENAFFGNATTLSQKG